MSDESSYVGKKFGLLTVLSVASLQDSSGAYCWICKCDCSKICRVRKHSVKTGRVRSCGCLQRTTAAQLASEMGRANRKHGKTKSPEYIAWRQMRQRCLDKKNKAYPRYGGRGIKICDRWSDFEMFLKDMGNRPTNRHTIDRINNDGNYCPENCRWATYTAQARNKNNTILLTYDGLTKSLAEWAECKNLNYVTLWSRLHVSQWSLNKALETPLQRRNTT